MSPLAIVDYELKDYIAHANKKEGLLATYTDSNIHLPITRSKAKVWCIFRGEVECGSRGGFLDLCQVIRSS